MEHSWTYCVDMDDRAHRHHRQQDRDLYAQAREQDGYFTAAQARAVGFSRADIGAAIVAGSWVPVEPGLYRLTQWRSTDLEEVARCCVWFDDAVVSHQSAAELHGLGSLHPQFLHVTAPTEIYHRMDRVAVHRSTLGADDCEHTGGFRITTPLRTVLDLAEGGVSQWVLDEVVGDAFAIGRLRRSDLEAAMAGRSERVEQRIGRALAATS